MKSDPAASAISRRYIRRECLYGPGRDADRAMRDRTDVPARLHLRGRTRLRVTPLLHPCPAIAGILGGAPEVGTTPAKYSASAAWVLAYRPVFCHAATMSAARTGPKNAVTAQNYGAGGSRRESEGRAKSLFYDRDKSFLVTSRGRQCAAVLIQSLFHRPRNRAESQEVCCNMVFTPAGCGRRRVLLGRAGASIVQCRTERAPRSRFLSPTRLAGRPGRAASMVALAAYDGPRATTSRR